MDQHLLEKCVHCAIHVVLCSVACIPLCVCVCVRVFVCVHFVGHYVFSLLVTCYLLFEHVWEVDVRALLRAHVS